MARTVAIVVAGGSARRMSGAENKVYLEVEGRPLLSYGLAALNRSPRIDEIVVVVRAGEHGLAARAIEVATAEKVVAIVSGGADRHGSEVAGLGVVRAAVERDDVDLIAIHDGARPFPSLALIESVVGAAREHGGGVPGVVLDEPLFRGNLGSPQRLRGLVRVQTPQAFRAKLLIAAYDAAAREPDFSAVDTAETVERFGAADIAVVPGEEDNLKVTYDSDVLTARNIASRINRMAWRELSSLAVDGDEGRDLTE